MPLKRRWHPPAFLGKGTESHAISARHTPITAWLPWVGLLGLELISMFSLLKVVSGPATTPVLVLSGCTMAATALIGTDVYRREKARNHLAHLLSAWEIELERLVGHTLVEAAERIKAGEDIDDVAAGLKPPVGCGPVFARLHNELVSTMLQTEERASGAPESVRRAFTALGQRMQVIHIHALRRLQQLQEQHHEHQLVFGILQELDHMWSTAARFTDSMVVLGGGRPGRLWRDPKPLFEVLRGAMSRIVDYKRVDLREIADVGVSGRAREHLQHVLAELLENATRFSPESNRVIVRAALGPEGVVIEIDDEGLGLTTESAAWAQDLLSGPADVNLEDIGERPRVGLTVAAVQAHRIGARLYLRKALHGGTRASVLLPPSILTEAPHPPSAPPTVPQTQPSERSAGPDPAPDHAGTTAHGLPVRRTRAHGGGPTPSQPHPAPQTGGSNGPTVTPASRAGAMAAFASPRSADPNTASIRKDS
jgi:signal transduction histidine kinase